MLCFFLNTEKFAVPLNLANNKFKVAYFYNNIGTIYCIYFEIKIGQK